MVSAGAKKFQNLCRSHHGQQRTSSNSSTGGDAGRDGAWAGWAAALAISIAMEVFERIVDATVSRCAFCSHISVTVLCDCSHVYTWVYSLRVVLPVRLQYWKEHQSNTFKPKVHLFSQYCSRFLLKTRSILYHLRECRIILSEVFVAVGIHHSLARIADSQVLCPCLSVDIVLGTPISSKVRALWVLP